MEQQVLAAAVTWQDRGTLRYPLPQRGTWGQVPPLCPRAQLQQDAVCVLPWCSTTAGTWSGMKLSQPGRRPGAPVGTVGPMQHLSGGGDALALLGNGEQGPEPSGGPPSLGSVLSHLTHTSWDSARHQTLIGPEKSPGCLG